MDTPALRIIAFGDSITAGSSLPDEHKPQVWVRLVEQKSRGLFVTVNEGRGGRPTDSLEEFRASLQRNPRADALLIALGTNDSRDISDECVPKATANLEEMIRLTREAYGTALPILLVGPPNIFKDALGPTRPIADERIGKIRELNSAIEALAARADCAFFSLYGVVPESALAVDGVHPDVAGNHAIAAALAPQVAALCGRVQR